MSVMEINIVRYLPILRSQARQEKINQKIKKQKDKDLKKLAKEVLKFKKYEI